jgi:hypothetical protein
MRIGVGADGSEVDFADAGRDLCFGNISTIVPRGRAPAESHCAASCRSETRSRRQATLTVSRQSSAHLTEAEPEDEMRDFVGLDVWEDAADTVDEKRLRPSGERLLAETAVPRSEDPADELRTVPKRKAEGNPRPRTPCLRAVETWAGGILRLAGTPASELLPESCEIVWSLPNSNFRFSFFLVLFASGGSSFSSSTGGVASFSMGFSLAQFANRAIERTERIARMAMDPVVEFEGTRRGGLCTSSVRGQDSVAAWGASLRGSGSRRGGSDTEADRTCAERSIFLEVALRTTLEPRESNRAREATASVGTSEARNPACEHSSHTLMVVSLTVHPYVLLFSYPLVFCVLSPSANTPPLLLVLILQSNCLDRVFGGSGVGHFTQSSPLQPA